MIEPLTVAKLVLTSKQSDHPADRIIDLRRQFSFPNRNIYGYSNDVLLKGIFFAENKILAVDISIWLNQAVKGFRDR